jgi:hypothetical protein
MNLTAWQQAAVDRFPGLERLGVLIPEYRK